MDYAGGSFYPCRGSHRAVWVLNMADVEIIVYFSVDQSSAFTFPPSALYSFSLTSSSRARPKSVILMWFGDLTRTFRAARSLWTSRRSSKYIIPCNTYSTQQLSSTLFTIYVQACVCSAVQATGANTHMRVWLPFNITICLHHRHHHHHHYHHHGHQDPIRIAIIIGVIIITTTLLFYGCNSHQSITRLWRRFLYR